MNKPAHGVVKRSTGAKLFWATFAMSSLLLNFGLLYVLLNPDLALNLDIAQLIKLPEQAHPAKAVDRLPTTMEKSSGQEQSRFARSDDPDDETKGDLQFSLVEKTELPPPPSEQVASTQPSPGSDAASDITDQAGAEAKGANLPEGLTPMLRAKSGGTVEISNFTPVSMSGSADECVALGQSLVSSARMSGSLLNILVSSPEITVAKICASNGSVILTCRAGRITISPRQARPDDRCERA